MKLARNIIICVVVAALLVCGGFFGYNKYIQVRNDRVIATVNGEEIKYGEFNYYVQWALESVLNEYGMSFDELKKNTNNFEEVVKERALQEAARVRAVCKQGKEVDGMNPNEYDENTLKEEKDKTIESAGGEKNFQKELKRMGMTEQQYDDLMMINYIAKWQALLQYEKLKLPEDQLREKYQNEYIKAQQIFFLVDDTHTDADAQKQVKLMYDLMKNGGDYFVLMNTYSEDPDLSNNPDGMIFTRGEMLPEFEEMAFSLQVDEIAPEAVKTEYGYHIIKRVDHMAVFEDIKDSLNLKIAQTQYSKDIQLVIDNAVVEKNEKNFKNFKVKMLGSEETVEASPSPDEQIGQ